MFILKSTHKQTVEELRQVIADKNKEIDHLGKQTQLADVLKDLSKKIDKSVDICEAFTLDYSYGQGKPNIDGYAKLLDDYFGGKVFEHESMPVTVLDEEGKATYHVTKGRPDENGVYRLVQK